MPTNNQIRNDITQRIISAIEAGGLPPWRKTWSVGHTGLPTNAISGRAYSGVNPMLLALHQIDHGFSNRHYATYKQFASVGAQVKRRPAGIESWGCKIVFCRAVTKEKLDRSGKEVVEKYFLLREFTVFNIEQTVGGNIDHLRHQEREDTRSEVEIYEEAEQAIAATGADIRHGGDQCFYDSENDYICVPSRSRFNSEYYASVCHELVHWTEHKDRLNWDRSKRGDTAYAEAELIAEIGACYLCSELGVPCDDMTNHYSYVSGWLSRMKQDSSFLFHSSSQASRAADYVLSFSREPSSSQSNAVTPAVVST